MILHEVRAHKEKERLPRDAQLAWKIAQVAADNVPVDDDVADMIGSRIIDNAAVASASLNRHPVMTARAQATAHPRMGGVGERHGGARTRFP
jgi:2-methylcitrate dehydratase